MNYQLFRMRRTLAGGLNEYIVQALSEDEAKAILLRDRQAHYHVVEILGKVGDSTYTMPQIGVTYS